MKYALIIGNDRYDDPKLAQLKTPAADSQALARILGDATIGSFDEVLPLINQSETRVRRAISQFLAGKKPDDLVLLYFSGHGVLDDRGRLYLALKDTLVSLLKATSIPSSFIADEMDSCRSRRQILVLDCCHSGAFARGTKGEQKAITENTFEGSGFGRVVLTASDSTQYALEGDQVIKQSDLSLFTHFLLEGLKTGEADMNHDGQVSLDEWYDYTYTRIIAETPRQVPHKWSYHQQGDLVIARNPFLKKKVTELPYELVQALESSFVGIRESAVTELGNYLHSPDLEMVQLAIASLERMREDDSRRISSLAGKLLTEFAQGHLPAVQSPAPPTLRIGRTGPAEARILHPQPKEGSPAAVKRLVPAVSSWVLWAGIGILAVASCAALFIYYGNNSDEVENLRTWFTLLTVVTSLVQWLLFRERLELWWVPVNGIAGIGLGSVHKYLYESTGWGYEDVLFLMAAWIIANIFVGLVYIRADAGSRARSPLPAGGARQNLFLLLLSVSIILAAVSNVLLALERWDPLHYAWILYGISAILASLSFPFQKDIPRNFGFITLAVFLLFDGVNVVRLAFNEDYPLYYFTANASLALASAVFFLFQKETRNHAGFLLLSGYLLTNGSSNLVLYDVTTDKFLYFLSALFAIPAALFFLIRRK
jgi:hypothetical protein